jgi:hypothetical protein
MRCWLPTGGRSDGIDIEGTEEPRLGVAPHMEPGPEITEAPELAAAAVHGPETVPAAPDAAPADSTAAGHSRAAAAQATWANSVQFSLPVVGKAELPAAEAAGTARLARP